MNKPETIFVLGGARSGKSRFALECASDAKGKKVFIATLVPGDEEMEERVRRHREERGEGWVTVAAPLEIAEALKENMAEAETIVIDCLTLWVSNQLMEDTRVDEIVENVEELCTVVKGCTCRLVLVSNEVGCSVVPPTKLGRQFRDAVGIMNQKLAHTCDRAVLVTAGIPRELKNK
jgi:adenosylcobinamide kinase/adenosylcobinamide-phosphate guanylyltransferase